MGRKTTIEKIDALIAERGISRRQLAKNAGISPSTLQSVFERNRDISVSMLEKICNSLGVPASNFLFPSIAEQRADILEEINEIKEEIEKSTGDERMELENSLSVLEESYEDLTFVQYFAKGLNQPTPIEGLPGLVDGSNMEKIPPFKIRMGTAFDRLNDEGQQKAVERVEELTEIPRYQKDPDSQD